MSGSILSSRVCVMTKLQGRLGKQAQDSISWILQKEQVEFLESWDCCKRIGDWGIGHDNSFVWSLVDRQIKVFDGLHPSHLTQIQVEWRADVFEALVIGENLTLIAQQILTSCYHSMNHHFKLEMKSWIAKLMFAQRSGNVWKNKHRCRNELPLEKVKAFLTLRGSKELLSFLRRSERGLEI